MPSLTLVDSDILIDVARGDETAIDYLAQLEGQSTLSVSVVTQMELMVGCRNKAEFRALERFLARFQIVLITAAISQTAVKLLRQYRLSHGLLIADGLIAATALEWEVPLASKNQRDYRFIEKLTLLPYE